MRSARAGCPKEQSQRVVGRYLLWLAAVMADLVVSVSVGSWSPWGRVRLIPAHPSLKMP